MSGYAQAPVGSASPLHFTTVPPKDPKGEWPKPKPKPPQNPPQNPPANPPSQTRSQVQSYNAPQYPTYSPHAAGLQPTQYPNYDAPKSASHPTGLEKKRAKLRSLTDNILLR